MGFYRIQILDVTDGSGSSLGSMLASKVFSVVEINEESRRLMRNSATIVSRQSSSIPVELHTPLSEEILDKEERHLLGLTASNLHSIRPGLAGVVPSNTYSTFPLLMSR